ncbi:MAG: L-threonylcarbamoyladenylate synthase [Holophagaceae bacterium]|jgi:tRNA threonylcarbamoyl adenosine modification protein (Sua5/YciO/YrdC/YwlC family)
MMIHLERTDNQSLAPISHLLKQGGVIAYPTDTIYGMGCLVSNPKAIERIFKLKARDETKPMSLLCSSHEMLSRYCQPLTLDKKKLLEKLLPGPYTFILSANDNVPPELVGEPRKTVGLRIPRHSFCMSIAQYLNEAIITTSVNRSGETPLNEPSLIEEAFGSDLAAIVVHEPPLGNSSTILDITSEKPLLVRAGAGAWPLS